MSAAPHTVAAKAHLRRLLVAVLVLFAQVTAAASMPYTQTAAREDLAALLDGQAICHADGPEDPGQPAPGPLNHPGHAHDCALCPACHLAAAPALIAPGDPLLLLPFLASMGMAAPPPPATGPPRGVRSAASPRGPPNSAV